LLHCRELRLLLGCASSCCVARDQPTARYDTDSAGGDEDVSS
jgi:hypothetical protein